MVQGDHFYHSFHRMLGSAVYRECFLILRGPRGHPRQSRGQLKPGPLDLSLCTQPSQVLCTACVRVCGGGGGVCWVTMAGYPLWWWQFGGVEGLMIGTVDAEQLQLTGIDADCSAATSPRSSYS